MKRTLALLLVLVGCGPAHGARTLPAPPVRPLAFTWAEADTVAPADRLEAEGAVRFALAAEERAHGPPLGLALVVLHGGADLPLSIALTPGYRGLVHWGPPEGARMDLVIGADRSCEWAYHEACHLRARLEDPAHADPRWATWERERLDVVAAWRAR